MKNNPYTIADKSYSGLNLWRIVTDLTDGDISDADYRRRDAVHTALYYALSEASTEKLVALMGEMLKVATPVDETGLS